jgi:hypothetical protein
VLEDRVPVGLVAGAAAVALVNDDQVEVVGRVVAEDPERLAAVGQRLVERKVDLPPGLRLAADLPDRIAEHRPELPGDGLIDEDVAVGEIEDSRLALRAPVARPELPDDLEREEGLAGARRQREQDALAVFAEDRLQRALDGDLLVVARLLHIPVGKSQISVERQQQRLCGAVVDDALPAAIALPELVGGGKRGEVALDSGVVVVLDDPPAVCGVGER